MKLVDEAKTRVKEITIYELQKKLKENHNLVIIDVREHNEFQTGHLEGSRYLSRGVIERDLERLYPNRDTEIIMYCCGGLRSCLAADVAQKLGYTNVRSLQGGFRELLHGGMKIREIEDHHHHYHNTDYSL